VLIGYARVSAYDLGGPNAGQFLGISKLCFSCTFFYPPANIESDFVVYAQSWVGFPTVIDMDVDGCSLGVLMTEEILDLAQR
jgi:hypothetical protein